MKDDIDYSRNSRLRYLLNSEWVEKIVSYKGSLMSEIDYDLNLSKVTSYLNHLVLLIHGVPPVSSVYIESGVVSEKFSSYEHFYRHSILWRHRKKAFPVTTNIFKGKFLAALTQEMSDELDDMVCRYVGYRYGDVKPEMKTDMLRQIIQCHKDLVLSMIDGKPYVEQLDPIVELYCLSIKGSPDKKKKYAKKILEYIRSLRAVHKNGILGSDFSDKPCILLGNICVTAYMLSANTPEMDFFKVKIDPNIRFGDDDVENVIRMLGKSILDYKADISYGVKNRNTKYKKSLYDIFYSALPEFRYRFNDINYDVELREGCRAISFLGFLVGSKLFYKILESTVY